MKTLHAAAAALCLALAALPALAAETPQTPDEQMIVDTLRTRGGNADQIDNALKWWRRLEEPFKARIRSAPIDARWAIILCDALGYTPGAVGAARVADCEADVMADVERGRANWSPDGAWTEPSAACKAAGKRDEWGRLVCD